MMIALKNWMNAPQTEAAGDALRESVESEDSTSTHVMILI
jgi:hypothetical protein